MGRKLCHEDCLIRIESFGEAGKWRSRLRNCLLGVLAVSIFAYARSGDPPSGHTGGFGEPNCTVCHDDFAVNSGPGSVSIVVPQFYTSGDTFPITVNVADPNQRRWGFELSSRTQTGQQAGTLIAGTDGFTQRLANIGSIQYIGHTLTGTRNGTIGGVSFAFQWQAPDASAGPVVFHMAANAANGDFNNDGDRIYLNSATVQPQQISSTPAVNDGGVVNNASFALHPAPIAPGTIIAIFGSNLTKDNVSLNDTFLGPDGKVTTTLGGASVKINGIAVSMLRAFPTQLVVQMPVELTDVSSAQVEVSVEGQTQSSTPRTFFVDAASPGIFSTASSGAGQGAILNGSELNQGLSSLVAPAGSFPNARPARAGETVVIFSTGLGPVSDPVPTGVLASGLHPTVVPVTVTIDGLPATVDFAGLAPGFVGLYQVNARVPANTRMASDIPVVLSIGGKQSNPVTIAVAP